MYNLDRSSKGPFKVGGKAKNGEDGILILNDKGECVAISVGSNTEEHIANACLFASARELYEENLKLKQQIEDLQYAVHHGAN